MVLYDSSALIDYLDGDDRVVEYVTEHVDERAVTMPVVMYEVYEGEIRKAGETDFDGVENALNWLTVVEIDGSDARRAAELQSRLEAAGTRLAARDAMIAGVAWSKNERLVASETDFDNSVLRDEVGVDLLR